MPCSHIRRWRRAKPAPNPVATLGIVSRTVSGVQWASYRELEGLRRLLEVAVGDAGRGGRGTQHRCPSSAPETTTLIPREYAPGARRAARRSDIVGSPGGRMPSTGEDQALSRRTAPMRRAASMVPQDSRYSTRFSRYSSTTGPGMVSRQERQIVQSWLDLDDSLPGFTSPLRGL